MPSITTSTAALLVGHDGDAILILFAVADQADIRGLDLQGALLGLLINSAPIITDYGAIPYDS